MRGLYINKDGGVSVIVPSQEALKIMTIEEIVMKDSPSKISPIIVDDSDIPQDNIFRDAWKIKNKKIKVNLNKAKEICHEKRRMNRDKAFKPLDIEATIPFKAKEAEAKRQIIRNNDDKLQKEIDNIKSVTKLKSLIKHITE